jgi:hypothetical protein
LLPGGKPIEQRQIVTGGRNRERSIRPKGRVFDERLEVAGQYLRLRPEANRPIAGIARMPTPGISVKIVHEVAAADDQDAFFSRASLLPISK